MELQCLTSEKNYSVKKCFDSLENEKQQIVVPLPKDRDNGKKEEEMSYQDAPFSEENLKTDRGDNLSDFQGMMLLIPYNIGMGFLGLPYMVKLLGLWGGLIGLLFYGFLNEFCILTLVDCTQILMDRTGEKICDISEIAEISMKLGPPVLRPHAGKYKLLVVVLVVINHFLFLADALSLMTMFANDLLTEVLELDLKLTMVLISVLLMPVYLMRKMNILVTTATLGNFVLLGIVAISFQYICHDLPRVSSRVAVKPVSYLTFTTFANDVMFTLDGIGVVLPVRTRMKSTKHFDGWTGVLGIALMFVTCFHAACGFYGYLKFGESTHVMYLLDLPLNNWLYKSLKILFFLSLYCITGVVVFVPVDISWRNIQGLFQSAVIQNYGEYVFRFLFLASVCGFTLIIPQFQLLMSLTGCLWAFFGTIVVPVSIKIMLTYEEMLPVTKTGHVQRTTALVIFHLLLIFGIYSTLSGLVVTLYKTSMNIVV
ncbi:proton-coupled amino acid transporter 3-like isoform X2 [Argopecten irradians]